VQRIASALRLSLMEAASSIPGSPSSRWPTSSARRPWRRASIARLRVVCLRGAGPAHRRVRPRARVQKVIVRRRRLPRPGAHSARPRRDILHVYEQVDISGEPVRCGAGERLARRPWRKGRANRWTREALPAAAHYQFSLDMRHKGQSTRSRSCFRKSGQEFPLGPLHQRSMRAYEQLYWERFVLRRSAPGDRHAAPARECRYAAAEALGDEEAQGENQSERPVGGSAISTGWI